MNKGALHYQEIPGWAKQLKQGRAFLINPPAENPFPGAIVYGRTYLEDNASNALVLMGEAGAELWYAKFKDQYERATYIDAWASPNEPPVDTLLKRQMLTRFLIRFGQLMHAAGYKVIGFNFSVWWPDLGTAMDFAPALPYLDFCGFHEYGYPSMRTDMPGRKCLHYRTVRAEWLAGGVEEKDIPPFIIDESGEDDGQKHGWKTASKTEPVYLADLQWYADEVAKDAYVLAFCVFTAGPQGWGDFEVTETLGKAIASPTAFVSPVVPLPPTPARLIQPLLAWPLGTVVLGTITQRFGENPANYAVFGLIGHNGLDIGVPIGTPVYASHAGQAWVYTDTGLKGGYGQVVEIWDPQIASGSAFKTIYAHLSDWAVADHVHVEAGQLIGHTGSTGNSTGPHIHFGIKLLQGRNTGYLNWTDPAPYLDRKIW